jgi:O-antigen/teichoic acid export membrane protein
MQEDVVSAFQFYQISRYVQNFLLSIVLVKSGLSLGQVGAFEIWLFAVTMAGQFWMSGLKDKWVSGYKQKPEDQRDDFLLQGFYAHIIMGLVSAVIFLFILPQIYEYEQNVPVFQALLFGAMYIILHALSGIPEIILLLKNKGQQLFYYGLFSLVIFICLAGLLFLSDTSLQTVFIIVLSFAAIKCLYLLVLMPRLKMFQAKGVMVFIRTSLPFISIALVGYGMDFLDGFLVVRFFDTDTFPVYKYGAREFPLSALLVNSLSVAMIPLLWDLQNLSQLRQKANQHMHLLFPVSIFLIWVSQPVFIFLYSDSFVDSALIFNLYLVILGSRVLMPHSILLAQGQQRWVLFCGIIELITNLILSLWWVRIWGLPGLVMATVVAYYMQKILMMYKVNKDFGISLKDIISVPWWIIYQLISFVSLYLNYIWLHG